MACAWGGCVGPFVVESDGRGDLSGVRFGPQRASVSHVSHGRLRAWRRLSTDGAAERRIGKASIRWRQMDVMVKLVEHTADGHYAVLQNG